MTEQRRTYCRLCEAQCGLIAEVDDDVIVAIRADKDHPVSRGHMCVKAQAMVEVVYDDDRILTPLKRTGEPGAFAPVSWDDALDDIAERLDLIATDHGGEALGVYLGNPSAFATMHNAYGTVFAKSFGSPKLYNATHVDTGARTLASIQVFGGRGGIPFPDLPDTDMLVMFGANPLVSNMSLIVAPRARRQLDAIHARGGVVVVDPRLTETARRFEHQPIKPDADIWLLLGMLRTVIEEALYDEQALRDHVEGWAEFFAEVETFSWDEIVDRSEVDQERIQALARRFAGADRAACYGRVGTNRGRFSTLTNIAIDALNLMTGNVGRAGGTVIGQSPFRRTASEPVPPDYDKARSRIGDLPLIREVQPGGGLADEILTPGDGQIRALFVDSGNPVLAYPDGDKAAHAFDTLDLFVSLDLYVTESNRYADYILPVPTFYERADVNDLWAANAPEPWLHFVDAVIEPRGDTRHEYWIYDHVLERLGKPSPADQVIGRSSDRQADHLDMADHALRCGPLGDQYGERPEGLSLAKLRDEHPSGYAYQPRVDAEATWTQVVNPSHLARLHGPFFADEFARLRADTPSTAQDLLLFGRRLSHTMNSWMHNVERGSQRSRPTLEMHPSDADARGLTDGQRVVVASRTGAISAQLEVTDAVVAGSVCYPHGFGHAGGWQRANALPGDNVNRLASSDAADWEPVSGNCHLDGIPVSVTAAPPSSADPHSAHPVGATP